MQRTIYKFHNKLLMPKEESLRMQLKAIELYKKQWADNRPINSVEPILLTITRITRVTNQETDQMDQLQELTLTKEEFIAQEDQSAVPLDQVQDPEPMEESPVLNLFSVWSSAHVNQIFKMSKTPDETL